MSSVQGTEKLIAPETLEIFDEGRHLLESEMGAVVDLDFSALTEPPLGQGSTIPVLELPRIWEGYNMQLSNITKQRRRIMINKGFRFNLMVAGQSGVGKSTFINNLFKAAIISNKNGNWDVKRPTANILCHNAKLSFGSTELHLNVTETPGYGEKIDNSFSWNPLVNYIDEQMRSHIYQEEQPQRNNLIDRRLHCCLYLLPPNNKNISTLDIITMRELSKKVNFIPVIAKADAFSGAELTSFKRKVRVALKENRIKVCRFLNHNDLFFDDIIGGAPFDIITSNDMNLNEKGEYVRSRKYKWGLINVENPENSSLCFLRTLLFDNHFFDFVASTEEHYAKCRRSILRKRIFQARNYLSSSKAYSIMITEDALEIIKELDFDNVDSNGLLNYSCYEIFNKRYMDSLLMNNDPIFLQHVAQLRKKMKAITKQTERKLMERIERIFYTQLEMNSEIEVLRNRLQMLQSEFRNLERTYHEAGPDMQQSKICAAPQGPS